MNNGRVEVDAILADRLSSAADAPLADTIAILGRTAAQAAQPTMARSAQLRMLNETVTNARAICLA